MISMLAILCLATSASEGQSCPPATPLVTYPALDPVADETGLSWGPQWQILLDRRERDHGWARQAMGQFWEGSLRNANQLRYRAWFAAHEAVPLRLEAFAAFQREDYVPCRGER
jgi:hypothetical protein